MTMSFAIYLVSECGAVIYGQYIDAVFGRVIPRRACARRTRRE